LRRLTVRVQGRHCRDAKFLPDSPPGQASHVTESHNFITPKNTLRSADYLTGSLSGRGVTDKDRAEIRKRCISQPTEHQQILLQRLGLRLPTALERAAM
jgi:hypothetical protein